MSWWLGPMLGHDLETTGTNVETDRPVQAACALLDPSGQSKLVSPTRVTLFNPEMEIHPDATAHHGITDEQARTSGEPLHRYVQFLDSMADALRRGIPVAGMNLAFDLTIADREARRQGVATLADRAGRVRPILDLFVIDKWVDPYRPGSRKLGAICEFYGVRLDQAHDALQDILGCCRALWRIGTMTQATNSDLVRFYQRREAKYRRYSEVIPRLRELGELPINVLHARQTVWRYDQACGLEKHFRETGPDPTIVLDKQWPYQIKDEELAF